MTTILAVYSDMDFEENRTPMQTEQREILTVEFSGAPDRATAIKLINAAQAIPKVSQQSSFNNFLYAMQVKPKFDREFPNVIKIEVLWRNITNITEIQLDPVKRAVLISRGTYKLQDTPNVDFDGKPVATTAGEPINYTYQRGFPTYRLEKNLASFPTWCGRDNDFINTDSVTIYNTVFDPYELYLQDIEVSHLNYEGQFPPFHRFTATLYANTKKDGWKTLLRNAGYHEKAFLGYYSKKGQKLTAFAVGFSPITNNGQTITFNNVKYFPRYGLQAIKMGLKGTYEYPSSPVLIDPNGLAYRQQLPNDPPKGPFTGPVIGLQSVDNQAQTSGITQKQWDASVVTFNFANKISFNNVLPLR